MKAGNAVEVKQVTKKFKIYYDKGRTLKEKVLFSKRRKYEEHMVLDGISFEIKKGEAVGLIGENGCGKSTTLKLLTRIMYPDSGSIEMCGRVSSLLELGAGFHPDMSGRQNIYINASIFGLSKKEIDNRVEQIIAFSELGTYIDNPVRTYSSGMYMRLAFAVAINVDADILLVDEILAVGDANFQAKCFNKLREIKGKGTTIVIVSHSLGQIEQICERSIWIKEGHIEAEGTPREVHPQYLHYMGTKSQQSAAPENADTTEAEQETAEENVPEPEEKAMPEVTEDAALESSPEVVEAVPEESAEVSVEPEPVEEIKEASPEPAEEAPLERWGNGNARIEAIRMYHADGTEGYKFQTGEKVKVELVYSVKKPVKDAVFGIAVYRTDGVHCYGTNTRIDREKEFSLKKSGRAFLQIEQLLLLPGEYTLDFAIESGYGIPVDYYTKALRIELYSDVSDVGISRIPHNWKV